MFQVDLPPSHPQVFYSLAATLIPIFLFGGIFGAWLSRPPKGASHRALTILTVAIPLFGSLAIVAEAAAINAAVAGEAGAGQRFVIVLALIVGMVATVGGAWLPWVSRALQSGALVGWELLGVTGLGLILIVGAYSVVTQMNDAIHLANETEKVSNLASSIRQRAAEIRESERRIDAYTYRLGRLRERRAIAIEHDEPVTERVVVIEIDTQEKLRAIEERSTKELFRTGQREIDAGKPDF